jgi:hypothetical protein
MRMIDVLFQCCRYNKVEGRTGTTMLPENGNLLFYS